MATSGTVVFRSTRDQIIYGALRLCSAIDPENPPATSSNQVSNAAEALNMLVKQYQADGLELWERKYGVIFPQNNQSQYILGSPGPSGDHATLSTPLGTGFVQTTTVSGISAGTTSVTLTSLSSSGTVGTPAITIASTWFIGIVMDSGNVFWTTVNGAPAGNVVTFASAATETAQSGNTVYSYQTKMERPLRILDAFFRQPGQNDIPFRVISREEYNRFGQKFSPGTSIQLYYDPQENSGCVYVYPVPTVGNTTGQIYIEFQKPIDDFVNSTDDFDMPQEWGLTLKFNLALIIAPEYSIPDTKFKQIQFLANYYYEQVSSWDQEYASVFIQPSAQMMQGLGGQGYQGSSRN